MVGSDRTLFVDGVCVRIVSAHEASAEDERAAWSSGIASWRLEGSFNSAFLDERQRCLIQSVEWTDAHELSSHWATEHSSFRELLRAVQDGEVLLVPQRATDDPPARKRKQASAPPPPSASSSATERLEAHWRMDDAYCGDVVGIHATVTPAPAGRAPATVAILDPSTGAAFETIAAEAVSGVVDASWASRARSTNWRTERFTAQVEIASRGLRARTTNTFGLRARPTSAWEVIDRIVGVGQPIPAAVREHVDARLEPSRVHYSLKARLHRVPLGGGASLGPVDAIFPAALQQRAKRAIETVWNRGFDHFAFHRTRCRRHPQCDCAFDCCKASFALSFNFVDSGEHYPVRIVSSGPPPTGATLGATNANNSQWAEPPIYGYTDDSVRSYLYPHEVGHMLGQFDEYGGVASACAPLSTHEQPCSVPHNSSVMAAFIGNAPLNENALTAKRHYRWALRYLNAHTAGDPYDTIPV